MSLSKPRGTASPVQRRFELKLAVGAVSFYDSEAKENVLATPIAGDWELDKNFPATPPFEFIVLDVLSVIGGYSDDKKSGIWSNEIRSTRDETLVVRTREGVIVEGLYANISDAIKAEGGKFGNSVYLAYRDGDEWKLGNLKLIGAGVSAWFDFKKGLHFDQDPGVVITGWTGLKKGRNEYFSPVFKTWQITENDLVVASALDEELQDFLSTPLAAKAEQEAPPAPAPSQGYNTSPDFDSEPPF